MQDNYFSLTRVRLGHFRSIASADVELGPLLLLVGPNGAGKSNFLDALRLLSESLQGSLAQALRNRGGVTDVVHRSAGNPAAFSVELEFRTPQSHGAYGFEVTALLDGGHRVSRESCAVWYEDRPAAENGLPHAGFHVAHGELTHTTEAVMPPIDNRRLTLVTAAGLDAFRPVYEGLAGISVFHLNPDVMRRPQTPDSGDLLLRDGANVASVLHRLQASARGRRDQARIEGYLRHIVPGMRGVSRTDVGGWETLEFQQEAPDGAEPWRFPAPSVSDGTLRALGVLVALFAGTGDTRSTIGIEEPENALHPAAAGVLLDALRDASERRQTIVTSHSPDLLDRHDFELSELRAVRSVDGETRIGPLDEAGALALREHLYTPGELLRNDQLLPAEPDSAPEAQQ